MEGCSTPDRMLELKIIALMRILYPEALIPASLDVDGIDGLENRINAGANLITSIIPPRSGFMALHITRLMSMREAEPSRGGCGNP